MRRVAAVVVVLAAIVLAAMGLLAPAVIWLSQHIY
jgi:hypothetical protein